MPTNALTYAELADFTIDLQEQALAVQEHNDQLRSQLDALAEGAEEDRQALADFVRDSSMRAVGQVESDLNAKWTAWAQRAQGVIAQRDAQILALRSQIEAGTKVRKVVRDANGLLTAIVDVDLASAEADEIVAKSND